MGRSFAIAYAQAGASGIALAARSDLSVVEKDVKSAAKAAGKSEPAVIAIKLDVVDVESVESAAAVVKEKFGRLDILVNNAGYLAPWKLITDQDPAEWWKTWEINVKGESPLFIDDSS